MPDYPAVTTISALGTVQKIIEMQHHFILLSNQSLFIFFFVLLLMPHFEAEKSETSCFEMLL